MSSSGVMADVRHLVLAISVAVCIFEPSDRRVQLAAIGVSLVVSLDRLLFYRPKAAGWSLIGLAVLMYASASWSAAPDLSTQIALNQAVAAGLFVAIQAAIDSRRGLLLVGAGYLAGCAGLLVALARENGLTSGNQFGIAAVTRYTIEGINPNFVSYSLASGIAVAALLTTVAQKARPVLVLTVLAFFVGILVTGTRGSLIAALAVAVWWWLVPRRLAMTGVKVMAGLLVALSVVIVVGIADDHLPRLFPTIRGRGAGDLSGRLELWPAAREVFFAHPFFGDGAGTVILVTPLRAYAHNAVLDVGSGVGLLGVALFVVALWSPLASIARIGQTGAMVVGATVAVCAAPLLSGYWYQTLPLWALVALVSRAVVAIEPDPDEEEAPITERRLARRVTPGR